MKHNTWRAEEEEKKKKKKKCVLILLNDTPPTSPHPPLLNSWYHLPHAPRPPPHTHPFSTPGITSLAHPRPPPHVNLRITYRIHTPRPTPTIPLPINVVDRE